MKLLRSMLSAAFAILVLFSSSSFVIGIHWCGGEIQNIALFRKAEGCPTEKKWLLCHRQASVPCCQDETVVHDAKDFKGNVTQIGMAAPVAMDVVQTAVLLSEVIPSLAISQTQYCHYDPPSRSSDLTVSYRVFLI